MPIYEYQCQDCGFETEVLQKLSEDPLTVCTSCGKSSFKKKISAAGFRLKGGGWYETDFKTGAKKNLAGSSDSKSSGGSGGASNGGSSGASNSTSTASSD